MRNRVQIYKTACYFTCKAMPLRSVTSRCAVCVHSGLLERVLGAWASAQFGPIKDVYASRYRTLAGFYSAGDSSAGEDVRLDRPSVAVFGVMGKMGAFLRR